MLRFILASLLLGLTTPALAQGVGGAPYQILCNKIAVMAAGPSTIQVVIPAVAGRAIHFCGWHVTNTAASGTFSITSGTQTTNPCDTGTVAITTALNVTSSAPSSDHNSTAIVSTATGAAVCVTPSVATIAAVLFYAQF